MNFQIKLPNTITTQQCKYCRKHKCSLFEYSRTKSNYIYFPLVMKIIIILKLFRHAYE